MEPMLSQSLVPSGLALECVREEILSVRVWNDEFLRDGCRLNSSEMNAGSTCPASGGQAFNLYKSPWN